MTKLFISISLALTSVFIISCKKNDIKNDQNTPSAENIVANARMASRFTGNVPTVTNEILVFASKNDLDSYLSYINDLEAANRNSDELDRALDEMENSLGYRSYRQFLASVYDSEEGFADIGALPVRRYHTTSFQSVLNDRFEVIVGKTYYNYSKEGYGIITTSISPDVIEQIRDLVLREYNVFEIIDKLDQEQIDADAIFEYHDSNSQAKKYHPSNENSAIRFQTNDEFGKNCDAAQYKITKVCAKGYGTINSSLAGDYTLNWGDGSPLETWTSTPIIGNWGAAHSTAHTYAAPGSYTITITYNGAVIGLGSASTSYPITITLGCGPSNGKSKSPWHYPNINGTQYALETTIWSDNNIFSKAIGASSYFYKQKNNGNWKTWKADYIMAQISGNTTDGNCNGSTPRYDGAAGSSDKNAKAKAPIGSDYSYQIINSNYTVGHNGQTNTYSNDLKTCN